MATDLGLISAYVRSSFWSHRIRFVFSIVIFVMPILAGTGIAHGDESSRVTDADYAEQRISDLIEKLNDRHEWTRARAIVRLGHLGPEARPAVSRLVDLLADDALYQEYTYQTPIYRDAKDALVGIGVECIGPLIDRFPTQSDEVKLRSLSLARRIGHPARAFLSVIHKAWQTTEEDRTALLGAMAAIDPTGDVALPILLDVLRNDKDEWMRRGAAGWLTRAEFRKVYWPERASVGNWFRHSPKKSSDAANALIAALKDPAAGVRGPAATSLATYPETADRSVPALLPLLADHESYFVAYSNHLGGFQYVSDDAVAALASFQDSADQSLTALVKCAKADARLAGSGGLSSAVARLLPHSKHPLEHLTALLEGRQPEAAFVALARRGKDSKAVIPKLLALAARSDDKTTAIEARVAAAAIDPEGLPDQVEFVRMKLSGDPDSGVYNFLASVGPMASFAVPLLSQRVFDKDNHRHLNWQIVSALSEIGPESVSVAPQILGCLDTEDSFYVENIEKTMVAFGPKVVPLVIEALKTPEKSPEHRIACLNILGRFGPAASEAVPSILLHTTSDHPQVRRAAVNALGSIGARPDESLPIIERLLSDPRVIVRMATASACGEYGPAAKRVLPTLFKGLSDGFLDVKLSTMSALGRLGPVAEEAIPALTRLTMSDNVLLRESAAEALRRIQRIGME